MDSVCWLDVGKRFQQMILAFLFGCVSAWLAGCVSNRIVSFVQSVGVCGKPKCGSLRVFAGVAVQSVLVCISCEGRVSQCGRHVESGVAL